MSATDFVGTIVCLSALVVGVPLLVLFGAGPVSVSVFAVLAAGSAVGFMLPEGQAR